MIEFSTRELAYVLGVMMDIVGPVVPEGEITGVSIDSRNVKPGNVFFALKGTHTDGSEFVEQAIASGAICAIVDETAAIESERKWLGLPVIPVPDTLKALGDTARACRMKFSGMVIAITGTSGKTTVKEMITAVLGRMFRVHSTPGNFNNKIGLPLTIFGLEDDHECAVLELGMSAPGEIAYLADVARPDMGIILNVGAGHIEFFDSLELVADAKTELFDALGPDHIAIVNGDDPLLTARESRCRSNLVKFGVDGQWNVRGEDLCLRDDGCWSFRVGDTTIDLHVPGRHNVYNALAAFTAGIMTDVPTAEIADALGSFTAPDKRMQIVKRNGVTWINDSYNANPMSMSAAAEVLANLPVANGGRRIAVLGDMLELGAVSESEHNNAGASMARAQVDFMILAGMFAGKYLEGALAAGMKQDAVKVCDSVAEAAANLNAIVRPGDVVLVKGSRGMKMELVLPREETV